jgi:hypothetical protein
MMAFRSLLVRSYLAGQRLYADIPKASSTRRGWAQANHAGLLGARGHKSSFTPLRLVILSVRLFALVATAPAGRTNARSARLGTQPVRGGIGHLVIAQSSLPEGTL